MARQSFQINIQGPSNPEEVSARYLAECRWDGVDAVEYVRRIRGNGENEDE